jgi:hypothetical protein
MVHEYHAVSVSAEPPFHDDWMLHATKTGVNTYKCVPTEWFTQEVPVSGREFSHGKDQTISMSVTAATEIL